MADGTVASLDDPVNRYVPWWTADKSDGRSQVTLRHLLSFTSGFGTGSPGAPANDESCMSSDEGSYLACARSLYATSAWAGPAGEVYSYNSLHLELAGAVALYASGREDIQEILQKYLFEPYAMAHTTCLPEPAEALR